MSLRPYRHCKDTYYFQNRYPLGAKPFPAAHFFSVCDEEGGLRAFSVMLSGAKRSRNTSLCERTSLGRSFDCALRASLRMTGSERVSLGRSFDCALRASLRMTENERVSLGRSFDYALRAPLRMTENERTSLVGSFDYALRAPLRMTGNVRRPSLSVTATHPLCHCNAPSLPLRPASPVMLSGAKRSRNISLCERMSLGRSFDYALRAPLRMTENERMSLGRSFDYALRAPLRMTGRERTSLGRSFDYALRASLRMTENERVSLVRSFDYALRASLRMTENVKRPSLSVTAARPLCHVERSEAESKHLTM